jgi:antitoxin HicB
MSEMKDLEYPFITSLLPAEEGGGYLIEFPDLPGCISDGDTLAEAIENGQDAVQCWMKTAKKYGDLIPTPGASSALSGKWLQRVPKSLHQRLAERAKQEGVSLNTLVVSILSQALGTSEGQTVKKKQA